MAQPDPSTQTSPPALPPRGAMINDGVDAPDCLFNTILSFLLPFFLTVSAGNPDAARATVIDLINAYNASTPTELDLVGRIIGFSIGAMDNLRLSMTPGLSDTKVLRYRCNAVALSRASDQARKILEALQAKQQPRQQIPRPSVVTAPAPKPSQPVKVPANIVTPTTIRPENRVSSAITTAEIDAMKRDARIMMNAFSKSTVHTSVSMPVIASPASLVDAAVRAAMSSPRRTSAA